MGGAGVQIATLRRGRPPVSITSNMTEGREKCQAGIFLTALYLRRDERPKGHAAGAGGYRRVTNAPGLIALYGVCFNSEVFPVDKGAKTTASYLVVPEGFQRVYYGAGRETGILGGRPVAPT